MMTRLKYFSIVLVGVAGLALATVPAAADQRPGWNRQGGAYRTPGVSPAYRDLAFRNGVSDGYDKGLEDVRRNRRYDPYRHGRFRSADHGYKNWYGPREFYRDRYRNGFRSGYEAGYRDGGRSQRRPGRGFGFELYWRP